LHRYDNKNSQEHTKSAHEQSKQTSTERKQVEEEPRGIEEYLGTYKKGKATWYTMRSMPLTQFLL